MEKQLGNVEMHIILEAWSE